ncbi:hypothetical protein ACB094_02G192100 [Castanea mollissima]
MRNNTIIFEYNHRKISLGISTHGLRDSTFTPLWLSCAVPWTRTPSLVRLPLWNLKLATLQPWNLHKEHSLFGATNGELPSLGLSYGTEPLLTTCLRVSKSFLKVLITSMFQN